MKDMNEIDKILEKKYKEIKVPDSMFDTKKLFKRIAEEKRRRTRRLRIASIFIIILITGVSILGIKLLTDNQSEVNEEIKITGKEEKPIEEEEKVISGEVIFDNSSNIYDNAPINYISVIEVKEILGYEIIDGVPSTRVKVNVERNYLNDLEGEKEMIIPGGKFIVKEIKSLLGIEDDVISKYKDNQYVNVTCENDVYIAEVEPDKQYLTTTYEKDGVLYICSGLKYGFKEYDEKTNTIKDADGNSVDVDMENYLKGK